MNQGHEDGFPPQAVPQFHANEVPALCNGPTAKADTANDPDLYVGDAGPEVLKPGKLRVAQQPSNRPHPPVGDDPLGVELDDTNASQNPASPVNGTAAVNLTMGDDVQTENVAAGAPTESSQPLLIDAPSDIDPWDFFSWKVFLFVQLNFASHTTLTFKQFGEEHDLYVLYYLPRVVAWSIVGIVILWDSFVAVRGMRGIFVLAGVELGIIQSIGAAKGFTTPALLAGLLMLAIFVLAVPGPKRKFGFVYNLVVVNFVRTTAYVSVGATNRLADVIQDYPQLVGVTYPLAGCLYNMSMMPVFCCVWRWKERRGVPRFVLEYNIVLIKVISESFFWIGIFRSFLKAPSVGIAVMTSISSCILHCSMQAFRLGIGNWLLSRIPSLKKWASAISEFYIVGIRVMDIQIFVHPLVWSPVWMWTVVSELLGFDCYDSLWAPAPWATVAVIWCALLATEVVLNRARWQLLQSRPDCSFMRWYLDGFKKWRPLQMLAINKISENPDWESESERPPGKFFGIDPKLMASVNLLLFAQSGYAGLMTEQLNICAPG